MNIIFHEEARETLRKPRGHSFSTASLSLNGFKLQNLFLGVYFNQDNPVLLERKRAVKNDIGGNVDSGAASHTLLGKPYSALRLENHLHTQRYNIPANISVDM